MDLKTDVLRPTGLIALGQLIGCGAMVAVFAVTGYYQNSVLWGSLCGAALACANFFFMSFFACKASDKAAAQDVAGGQKLIHLSYMGRMAALLLALVLLAKSGFCHVLALALPLAFNRPILTVYELLSKKGGAKV